MWTKTANAPEIGDTLAVPKVRSWYSVCAFRGFTQIIRGLKRDSLHLGGLVIGPTMLLAVARYDQHRSLPGPTTPVVPEELS